MRKCIMHANSVIKNVSFKNNNKNDSVHLEIGTFSFSCTTMVKCFVMAFTVSYGIYRCLLVRIVVCRVDWSILSSQSNV